jgi:hypothetical protein
MKGITVMSHVHKTIDGSAIAVGCELICSYISKSDSNADVANTFKTQSLIRPQAWQTQGK